MRKAGGSTLQATISKLLDVPVVQAPCLNDFDNLSLIAKETKVISFAHLHPTRESMDFIKNLSVPIIVLLRDPEDAYEALKRHKTVNGDKFRPNGALYYRQSKKVMNEFYANWLSIRDIPHVEVILYDNLYNDFNMTVKVICEHFGHSVNVNDIIQENRRHSKRVSNHQTINISMLPISEPSFQHYPVITPLGRFRFIVAKLFHKYVNKIGGKLKR
jgi:hypothetical protein